jgi:hypothetical protein
MAAYLPPTSSNQSIYNPLNFPSLSDDLSVQEGNRLYVQTGTANQNVAGVKTFSRVDTEDLRINGDGFPIIWNRAPGITTSLANQAGNAFTSGFLFPTYTTNRSDVLVANTNAATLTNKTLGTLQVGTNGSTFNSFQTGTFNIPGGLAALGVYTTTITFPTAFTSQPRVLINISSVNAVSSPNNFILCSSGSITASNFILNAVNLNSTTATLFNAPIVWMAFN